MISWWTAQALAVGWAAIGFGCGVFFAAWRQLRREREIDRKLASFYESMRSEPETYFISGPLH